LAVATTTNSRLDLTRPILFEVQQFLDGLGLNFFEGV